MPALSASKSALETAGSWTGLRTQAAGMHQTQTASRTPQKKTGFQRECMSHEAWRPVLRLPAVGHVQRLRWKKPEKPSKEMGSLSIATSSCVCDLFQPFRNPSLHVMRTSSLSQGVRFEDSVKASVLSAGSVN